MIITASLGLGMTSVNSASWDVDGLLRCHLEQLIALTTQRGGSCGRWGIARMAVSNHEGVNEVVRCENDDRGGVTEG